MIGLLALTQIGMQGVRLRTTQVHTSWPGIRAHHLGNPASAVSRRNILSSHLAHLSGLVSALPDQGTTVSCPVRVHATTPHVGRGCAPRLFESVARSASLG